MISILMKNICMLNVAERRSDKYGDKETNWQVEMKTDGKSTVATSRLQTGLLILLTLERRRFRRNVNDVLKNQHRDAEVKVRR